MIVASVSYKPDPIELGVNVLNIKNLSLRAATNGAKLIVFPELSLGGQNCVNVQDAQFVCQKQDGFAIKELELHSRKLGIYLIVGYVEYDNQQFYNSVIVFGPSGIVGNFRKTNLYGRENLWATKNLSQHPILNLPNLRLGVLAGNDLVKNELNNGQIYQSGSVDVVVSPMAWYGEYSYPDAAWMEAHQKLNASMVIANRWGFEEPVMLHGGAIVLGQNGEIFVENNKFEEDCIVYGDV